MIQVKCLRCGEDYQRPVKSRATYCKKCSDMIKKPSRLNMGPIREKNCYDYPPTRRG